MINVMIDGGGGSTSSSKGTSPSGGGSSSPSKGASPSGGGSSSSGKGTSPSGGRSTSVVESTVSGSSSAPEPKVSADTIPTAPGPTCPPGERLYKVYVAGEGTKYVYAPSSASREQIQAALGTTRGISYTEVMSPAAYPGGVYPHSKVVETVGGQKVTVPYNPEKEARSEYLEVYGTYPWGGKFVNGKWVESKGPRSPGVTPLAASQIGWLEKTMGEIAAGTYVPVMERPPEPAIQALMDKYGWTRQQAESEARLALSQVMDEMGTITCGGLWPLKKGETELAIAYLTERGRTEDADRIRQHYVNVQSTLEGRVKAAAEVGLLPSKYLDETTGSYDFLGAVASGDVRDEDLARIGLDKSSRDSLVRAGQVLGVLQSGGYCSKEGCDLVSALGEGAITEAQAGLLFSRKDVEEAKMQVAQMGLVPSLGGLEVKEKTARLVFNPIGGLWYKGPGHPWEVQLPKGRVAYFGSKREALDYIKDRGLEVESGIGATLVGLGADIWSLVQTPGGKEGGAKKKTARLVFNPLGGLWYEGPGYEWEVQEPGGFVRKGFGFGPEFYYSPEGTTLSYFSSKQEALDYIKSMGWEVESGVGATLKGLGADIWSLTQTPEFVLATAGISSAIAEAPAAIAYLSTSLSRFVPSALAGWLTSGSRVPQLVQGMKAGTTPVTLYNIGKTALYAGEATVKALTIPTVATTAAATWAGLSYKPPPVEVKGTQSFEAFKASPEYSGSKKAYLEEAGIRYDRAVASGEVPAQTREEYLRQAAEEFDPLVKQWFVEQAGKGMEYQPGIIGVLGRGGAVANIPVQEIQSLGLPSLPKDLLTGSYNVMVPLSVTQQLYSTKGLASLATLIPYYGPVTVAGAMTWKDQPWYGKVGTVGFTVLPSVSPLVRFGGGRAVESVRAREAAWRVGHMTPEELLAYQGVYPQAGETVLPRYWATRKAGSWGTAVPGELTYLGPRVEVPSIAWEGGYEPTYKAEPILTGRGWIWKRTGRPIYFPSIGRPGSFWRLQEPPLEPSRWKVLGQLYTPEAFYVWDLGETGIRGLTQKWYITPEWMKPGGGAKTIEVPWRSVEAEWVRASREAAKERARLEAPVYEPGPWQVISEKQAERMGREGWEVRYNKVTGNWEARNPRAALRPRPKVTTLKVATKEVELPRAPIKYEEPLLEPRETSVWWERLPGGFSILRVGPRPAVTIPVTALATPPVTTPVTTPVTSPIIRPVAPTLAGAAVGGPAVTFEVTKAPSLSPAPAPAPAPVTTVPTPTPILNPPKWKPKPPVPPFGLGAPSLGGGFGALPGRRLGIGRWRFRGFPVSGPHPLRLGTVGYTWMGGVEVPWGTWDVERRKRRGAVSGGLVRVV